MTLIQTAQDQLKTRLPKVIDARTHGIIDYAHAAFFLGVAMVLRRSNPRAATAAAVTGGLVLGQSLLTDYPLGKLPVLSFEQHGSLDGGFAGISWLLPRFFGFSGTGAANIFRLNSLVESAVVGMTDWNSDRARQARSKQEPRAVNGSDAGTYTQDSDGAGSSFVGSASGADSTEGSEDLPGNLRAAA